jgi:hypothetical protein
MGIATRLQARQQRNKSSLLRAAIIQSVLHNVETGSARILTSRGPKLLSRVGK